MDNLIKKLEVIASLTEGMTLSTSQFPTLISHNSWSTTIWRTYSREDRQKTVLYIRDILDAAVTLLKALSEEQQVELKSHIVSALKGFETLKLTYKGDFTTLGLITSIIDNVTSLLNGDPLFFKYVVNKNYDEIEKYLYDGMDVNVLNSKGQNVMHLLCHKEHYDAKLVSLCYSFNIDLCKKDLEERDPLYYAITTECTAAVIFLESKIEKKRGTTM